MRLDVCKYLYLTIDLSCWSKTNSQKLFLGATLKLKRGDRELYLFASVGYQITAFGICSKYCYGPSFSSIFFCAVDQHASGFLWSILVIALFAALRVISHNPQITLIATKVRRLDEIYHLINSICNLLFTQWRKKSSALFIVLSHMTETKTFNMRIAHKQKQDEINEKNRTILNTNIIINK